MNRKFGIGEVVKHKLADIQMIVLEVNNQGYVCRWHGQNMETREELFLKDTFIEEELAPLT